MGKIIPLLIVKVQAAPMLLRRVTQSYDRPSWRRNAMDWMQQEDETWVARDAGRVVGVVRNRDGSYWGEPQPSTGGEGSLEQPGSLNEEQFEQSMSNLQATLGPFDALADAQRAVEQATREA
jgi:hypothetical protein